MRRYLTLVISLSLLLFATSATVLLTPSQVRGAGLLARQATPVASAPAGSLAEMLALAPELPIDEDQPGVQLAQFADSAAQMEAVGVERPSPGDTDELSYWHWANWWMPFPFPPRCNTPLDPCSEVFGFDITQVDRTLVIGESPNTVAIYQGRFDETALRMAWESSGYQPVDLPGALVYSLSEDETIDFEREVHQLALASMNNLALLPDGTLLAASRLDNLERALATIRGEAPSLLDRPDVAALVAAGDPGLVAAYLVTGEALRSDGSTGTGSDAMPAPELALVGLTAGGPLINVPTNDAGTPEPFLENPPVARFVVSLLFAEPAAADVAAAIVEERLPTGASEYGDRAAFVDIFATWTIEVATEAPVLVVDLSYQDGVPPRTGLSMFMARDLGFVAW